MSIAKRVIEAIDKFMVKDYEGSFIPTCIAVDATATREFPNDSNNVAYKTFIHNNLSIVTRLAFGGVTMYNINLKYSHPDIKVSPDGMCSIEQVLYHAVRCGLVHKATLPSNIKFTMDGEFKVTNDGVTDILVLPATLAIGLIAAVVTSPVNAKSSIPSNYGFNFRGKEVKINELWGDREKLLQLLDN